MKIKKLPPLLVAIGLLAVTSQPVSAITNEQKSMLDQLDMLDKQEFVIQIERANTCIRTRDFDCAEKRLVKAAKYITGPGDKRILRLAKEDLSAERQRVMEEARLRAEEERRQADEERRLAEEERQLRERQERAEMEARRLEEEASAPSTAELIKQFGDEFLKNYGDELARSRAAKAQAYEVARQRQAEIEAANARQQELFARQKAQMEADRRAREYAAAASRAETERRIREAAAKQAREAQERLAQQERQREQAELQAQALRKEQERKREQEARKAEAERKKQAEQQAAKQAEEQYLRQTAAGVRLAATKCMDGEGNYYATGTRPNIRPEVVSCVDVRFRAYCPGSTAYSEGNAHNFIGMAGCYGDTYDISPKPPCDVKEVRIEVIEATACR